MSHRRTIRRFHLMLATGIVLTALALAPAASVQSRPAALPRVESERVMLESRVGGLVTAAVPLDGSTALMAEGTSLVHIDLSGGAPQVLGQRDLGHGIILDFVRAGELFYAVTEEGVIVLRQGDASLPDETGFAAGSGQALAASGRIAVVAARQAGLRVLEVDGRGQLSSVARLPLEGDTGSVALEPGGRIAYAAAGDAGIYVIDLTQPAVPRLERHLPELAPADSVALAGALMVIGRGEQIAVVDPSAGATPVGVYAPLRHGRRAVAAEDAVFVADEQDGLKVLALPARSRPVQVYGEVGHPARDVWLAGDLVYLAGPGGLRVLDVSSRSHPLELGALELPGDPQGVAVENGRAYVALGDAGVAVLNVSNPTAPQLEQQVALPAPARALLVASGRLHVAADEAGVVSFRLADGQLQGSGDVFDLPAAALDIAYRNNALYVAGGDAGLLAIDIAYADAPVLAGTLPAEPGQMVTALTIQGKRAYLADGDGLVVADVSTPDRMGRLARERVPDAAGIAVLDTLLYVVGGEKVTVYDARATAEPVLLRAYTGMGRASTLAVLGDRVFVTGSGDGPELAVLSLQSPDYPVELDSTTATGQTYRPWPTADGVWLARGYNGLRAYRLAEGGGLALLGDYASLGAVGRLALDGGRLLVGGQAGWGLLGLQTGSSPRALGQSADALAIRDVALDGSQVAVAAGDQGAALYALDGATGPVLVARHTTQGPATGVSFDERFVYISDAGGLSVFDRRYMLPVTSVRTPAPANGLLLRGNTAYLPLANGEVAVIDLADPTGGVRPRSTAPTRRAVDLIPGDAAGEFYALADDTVARLDASNPDALTTTITRDLRALADYGLYAGGRLWAVSAGGTRLYDLGGIPQEQPLPAGQISLSAAAMIPNGDSVYLALGGDGLGLARVSAPEQVATLHTQPVQALLRAGDVLYALGDALTAWDVQQADRPRLLDTLEMASPGQALSQTAEGRLLLSLESGLGIVEWDGKALTMLGLLSTEGAVDRAVQVGQRAFLAMHRGGLLAVDVSDPANPVRLFNYTSPSGRFARDLAAIDGGVILISWEGGVEALDVSQAASTPRLAARAETGYANALDLSLGADGERAALALGAEGVLLGRLTEQGTLEPAGYADTPGDARHVSLDGGVLYVADGECGLRVLDVADPAAPDERGYWRSSYASDVVLGADGSVYLAEANQLLTLRYDPAAPAELPPLPQFPVPASGTDGVPLDTELQWGPAPPACTDLTYRVYLGVADDPPFAGQAVGNPSLQVVELDPLRLYRWRVEATDRQGDVVSGPVWRFTTAATEDQRDLLPAPPVFVQRIRRDPRTWLALGAAGAAAVAAYLWRTRRLRR